jgi:hypothetical protein
MCQNEYKMSSKQPTLGSLKDLIQKPAKKAATYQMKTNLAENVPKSAPVDQAPVPRIAPKAVSKTKTKSMITFEEKPCTMISSTSTTLPTPKEIKSSRSSSRSEKKTKIGSYSSAEFQNWLNTPIQKPKMKRSKKTNDDAYQVFQDFADMVEHAEWKNFFQKLYTGKFPHGYSYRNQTLFFRKRTKIEKLEIIDSSRGTLSKVMTFFTTYGGYSNQDDDLNIFEFVASQAKTYDSWKDIRSKKTKMFFIQKYADELVHIYELSESEKRLLIDTIHTGFLLKTIDSGDIEFKDKKISNIKSLIWNPENREFEIPYLLRTQKNIRKLPTEKVQRNTFSSHWNKFVNHILKTKTQGEDLVTDDLSSVVEDLTDTTISMSVVSET